MDNTKLTKIKLNVLEMFEEAENILTGESDGYDGADGARCIKKLCEYCNELIEALEKDKTHVESK